jgi:transposase
MLLPSAPARNPSSRLVRFLAPAWHDDHPDFCRIDATLPQDHHARWLAAVVSRLDLTAFRLAYKGYGSLAYPVELLLSFVLFLYSKGILSPAEWANHARYDDQSKWILRGLVPSRSLLYTFRDRTEPFLDDLHRQLIAWAIAEGVTTASRGSLDGTFVAALASRHQLMSSRRLDRRLLLLRLLVWIDRHDDDNNKTGLADQLDSLPERLLDAIGLFCLTLPWGNWQMTQQLLQGVFALLYLMELLDPQEPQTPQQPQTPQELQTPQPLWQPHLPAWVPATRQGRQRVLRRYEDAQQRLSKRLQPLRDKKKLSKKDQQTLKRARVSLTDPEAALGFDKLGTYRPLYNVPLVQVTDAPLTLSWEVLPRNNDDGLLRPMMQKSQKQVGKHLDEVLVDGAFLTVGDAVWCEKEGILIYAPPGKAEAAKAEADKASAVKPEQAEKPEGQPQAKMAEAKQSVQKQEKMLPKSAFRYDSEEQVYYCPEGKRLEVKSRTTEKRQEGKTELPLIVYQASGEDCQGCSQQKRCTSNPKKGRTVKRYEGEEAVERIRQRMQEPAQKKVYQLRKQTVELGYADIKEHRGLRVFRCFGIKRARAQVGLVILASNGLKLLRILQQRRDAPQLPPPPEKQPA